MSGSVLTLRGVGLVLGLIAAVFALIAINAALQTRMGPSAASGIVAGIAFLSAIAAWVIAAIREHYKRQRALRMVQTLLQASPVVGLAAAVAAGAAARFGINADDAVQWMSALVESGNTGKA